MNVVNATIDRFEGDRAVLTAGAQRFTLPRTVLPAGCAEGEAVVLTVTRAGERTAEKKQQAKEILNEILHSAEE
ncbi:hypothetical protein A2477_01985 [Candidatus Falkowbacteria bacterium RIFOXYC2_FULL_47_12]|uniref:DUF3006 domain-containing protein n=2 Tax=Candidatus Falkowiibacteriota TaxID=1752728 RepID=A0A1F5TPD3_9BACT|nr:MAG: hypothetical protein A2242_03865 [Candidatus Falkowbacteria bacterium RIFOXYA2_FULL_47_9]OGF40815.1 MAG: hypothetical protein A2477_01985 [Candidatus Falkowbacteria bacterium RIFOXYC2_FULL_47_12]